MSRIYFHTPTDEAELRGSERAHMGLLVSEALLWSLNLQKDGAFFERNARTILKVLHSGGGYPLVPKFLPTHLSVSSGNDYFDLGDGRRIEVWSCALNTLLASGSDPMKLAARLHGQCEIHAFVEGPNRKWLAGVMWDGRDMGVFRDDQDWEDVIKLLLSRDDEPVVTSYSVCDGFPNSYVAERGGFWKSPEDYDGEPSDAWYDLSPEEQWDLSMQAVRKPEYGCELTPDRWAWPDMFFGEHPITGWNVAEAAHALEKK